MSREARRAVRGVEMMQVLALQLTHSGRMSERQMMRQPTPLSMARWITSGWLPQIRMLPGLVRAASS